VKSTHAEARALDRVVAAYLDDIRQTTQMVTRALASIAGR
jgi:allophanate hydrolase